MQKIIIYSTPTCHYCKDAKEYFDSKKLKYTVFDVSKDLEKREQMIEESGHMGVPVIKIGKKILIGFNKDQIEEALK